MEQLVNKNTTLKNRIQIWTFQINRKFHPFIKKVSMYEGEKDISCGNITLFLCICDIFSSFFFSNTLENYWQLFFRVHKSHWYGIFYPYIKKKFHLWVRKGTDMEDLIHLWKKMSIYEGEKKFVGMIFFSLCICYFFLHFLSKELIDNFLSEAGLADDHEGELEAPLHRLPLQLVGQQGKTWMKNVVIVCNYEKCRDFFCGRILWFSWKFAKIFMWK